MIPTFARPVVAQHERELAEQKLRDLYGESTDIRTKTVALSDSLRASILHLAGTAYIATKVNIQCMSIDNRRMYAVLDNVFGKEQPITYMVVFDDSERIRAVEILAYREAYGGEVGYKSFRKQFEGKSYNDNLRVGSEIRNITGATISTNAVTTGVRKVSALFHVVRDQLR